MGRPSGELPGSEAAEQPSGGQRGLGAAAAAAAAVAGGAPWTG